MGQTGRDPEHRRLSSKKFSSKSADRKRNKSVNSKKKQHKSFEGKKQIKKKPPQAMSTIQPKMRTIDN
jgi:hypothetical protein